MGEQYLVFEDKLQMTGPFSRHLPKLYEILNINIIALHRKKFE